MYIKYIRPEKASSSSTIPWIVQEKKKNGCWNFYDTGRIAAARLDDTTVSIPLLKMGSLKKLYPYNRK